MVLNLNIDVELQKIISAAVKGGRAIKKYFNKVSTVKTKSTRADIQTIADLEAEKIVLKILSKEFPKYSILSEESGEKNKESENILIVDPLDGTNNFVLGIPYFSVSIALLKNKTFVLGVVYNPILNQLYFAKKGGGAFFNNKKLHVNKETQIENATVAYLTGYLTPKKINDNLITSLDCLGVKRVLINWSPALDFCALAAGKIEAIINYKNEIYHYAAGKLIAKEAGALITNFQGKEEREERNNVFLVSNGSKIHREILRILNKIE
jgi:myo-inositol-1(or 4)-monophosphatase